MMVHLLMKAEFDSFLGFELLMAVPIYSFRVIIVASKSAWPNISTYMIYGLCPSLRI